MVDRVLTLRHAIYFEYNDWRASKIREGVVFTDEADLTSALNAAQAPIRATVARDNAFEPSWRNTWRIIGYKPEGSWYRRFETDWAL